MAEPTATVVGTPDTPGPLGETEARLGDRGDASGRNIEQNRAIGQDDPMEGSRMGREQHKKTGGPGEAESANIAAQALGTDAAQNEDAERLARDGDFKRKV